MNDSTVRAAKDTGQRSDSIHDIMTQGLFFGLQKSSNDIEMGIQLGE